MAFVKATLVPALLSLPITWALIALFYRGRWFSEGAAAMATPARAPLDRRETTKAAVVAIGVVLAFALTDWPRPWSLWRLGACS